MREWVTVTIRCDNSEVRKQCALALMGCNVDQFVDWEEEYPEYPEVGADMWEYIPSQEIQSVSMRFPNNLIIYDYHYELNGYTEYRSMTFLNGKGEHKTVKHYDYNFTFIPVDSAMDRMRILEKAKNFFRKLDREEVDAEGYRFINWFPEKVSYEFDFLCEDGITVRVIATKLGHKIGFEVVKDGKKYDWRDYLPEDREDEITYDWADFDGKAPSTLLH